MENNSCRKEAFAGQTYCDLVKMFYQRKKSFETNYLTRKRLLTVEQMVLSLSIVKNERKEKTLEMTRKKLFPCPRITSVLITTYLSTD